MSKLSVDGVYSDADALITERTRSTPSILWIELTSRCPFDCVFCSRALLRGKGQHLDFDLYRRLIAELDQPQVIRLNYSGESSHYPHLVEACALASQRGAEVELVTALAALPEHKLEPLVASGLTRLTISLHTLDAEQFQQIYRFSSLDAMRQRIERVVELAPQRCPRPLIVDFAFVAMARNLSQLPAVAAYARDLGLTHVAVHPVIRRDPIPERFEDELDQQGRLRDDFVAALRTRVDDCRHDVPEITISVSTPELGPRLPLTAVPRHHPWPLLGAARLHDCDQDPWETVHILADGRVVTCEVRDQIELGRLDANTTLRDIWSGPAYRAFRQQFVIAADSHCRACPYKRAQLPQPLPSQIRATDGGAAGLLSGWHACDEGAAWSRPQAVLALAPARWPRRPRLRGKLPPAADGSGNRLTVSIQGAEPLYVHQQGRQALEFDIVLPQPTGHRGPLVYRLEVSHPFRPSDSDGSDDRLLGIALYTAGA
ncbi:MAG: radical SAM protein [Rhodanobacteraceae bacterium]|nr:radical SAM protein [Rhodanobacteraceae bacterium]